MQTLPTPLTLAPVTPAVAALLHQLQAELIKGAEPEATAPLGAIVLPPLGTDRRFSHRAGYDGSLRCEFRDGAGGRVTMVRRLERPNEAWASYWHPSHWNVHEERVDARGRTWQTYIGAHVTDDFGTLVEVPE